MELSTNDLQAVGRSDFIEDHFCVRRRYSDFVWLKQQLDNEFATLFLPVSSQKSTSLEFTDSEV